MNERLIDVLNAHDRVLHVFPIAVEDQANAEQEAKCKQEALKAATHLQLVPEAEMGSLHARMHVSRGGQLTPFSDVLQIRAEQRLRTRAYFLWQLEGFPENRADENWHQACEIERHGASN